MDNGKCARKYPRSRKGSRIIGAMPKKPSPLKRLLDSWRELTKEGKIAVVSFPVLVLTLLAAALVVPEVRRFLGLEKEPEPTTQTQPQQKETPKDEVKPPAGTQIEPTVVPIPNTPFKKPKSNGNMVLNRPSRPSSESTTTAASNRNRNQPAVSAPAENASESEPPAAKAETRLSQPAKYSPTYVEESEALAHLVKRVDPAFPKVELNTLPANVGTRVPEGSVILDVLIHTDGTVTVEDVRSSHHEFYKPAEDAMKQWVFKPFIIDGKPTEVYTFITLEAQKPDEKKHDLKEPQ